MIRSLTNSDLPDKDLTFNKTNCDTATVQSECTLYILVLIKPGIAHGGISPSCMSDAQLEVAFLGQVVLISM